jgi:hypothetical protein
MTQIQHYLLYMCMFMAGVNKLAASLASPCVYKRKQETDK